MCQSNKVFVYIQNTLELNNRNSLVKFTTLMNCIDIIDKLMKPPRQSLSFKLLPARIWANILRGQNRKTLSVYWKGNQFLFCLFQYDFRMISTEAYSKIIDFCNDTYRCIWCYEKRNRWDKISTTIIIKVFCTFYPNLSISFYLNVKNKISPSSFLSQKYFKTKKEKQTNRMINRAHISLKQIQWVKLSRRGWWITFTNKWFLFFLFFSIEMIFKCETFNDKNSKKGDKTNNIHSNRIEKFPK